MPLRDLLVVLGSPKFVRQLISDTFEEPRSHGCLNFIISGLVRKWPDRLRVPCWIGFYTYTCDDPLEVAQTYGKRVSGLTKVGRLQGNDVNRLPAKGVPDILRDGSFEVKDLTSTVQKPMICNPLQTGPP